MNLTTEEKPVYSLSLKVWFLSLLMLNILDIVTTIPNRELNPVTLCIWGKIGFFLAAWAKIGLVALFGALCLAIKKVATPDEWHFASRLLGAVLTILVAFYIFVVAINLSVHVFMGF
jgi:hypothetical protein